MAGNVSSEFHCFKKFVSLLYHSHDQQMIVDILGMEFSDFEAALLFLERLVVDYDGHHY